MELEDEIRQPGGSQIMLDTGCYPKRLRFYLVGGRELGRVEVQSDMLSFSFGLHHCDRGTAKVTGR